MSQLVEVYARQLLNPDSDLEGSDEKRKCANIYIAACDAIRARRKSDVWKCPPGLSPLQVFPDHIFSFIGQLHITTSPFTTSFATTHTTVESVMEIPLQPDRRSIAPSRRGRSAGSADSPIQHSEWWSRCVRCCRPIGARQVVGSYYGTLMYKELKSDADHTQEDSDSDNELSSNTGTIMYGEGILASSVEDFSKWALKTQWRARGRPLQDRRVPRYKLWVFPTDFCTMRFINDPRYMPDEPGRPSAAQLDENPHLYRQSNVEFRSSRPPTCNADFRNHNLVQVIALRNIPTGGELYVDYGQSYAAFSGQMTSATTRKTTSGGAKSDGQGLQELCQRRQAPETS